MCRPADEELIFAGYIRVPHRLLGIFNGSSDPRWCTSLQATRRHRISSTSSHATSASPYESPPTRRPTLTLAEHIGLEVLRAPPNLPLLSPRHGPTDKSLPSAPEREGSHCEPHAQSRPLYVVIKQSFMPPSESGRECRRLCDPTCP